MHTRESNLVRKPEAAQPLTNSLETTDGETMPCVYVRVHEQTYMRFSRANSRARACVLHYGQHCLNITKINADGAEIWNLDEEE